MEHEARQVTFQGGYSGEVTGWVRPRLTEEEHDALQERLIQWRFENVDEYLARIDDILRELAQVGALDADAVNALQEARAAVMKLRPTRPGSTTG